MDSPWPYLSWRPSLSSYDDEANKDLFNSFIEHHHEFRHPSETVLPHLEARLRSYTFQLHQEPYRIRHWMRRSNVLLKLWYPELAASDAYKAYLLAERARAEWINKMGMSHFLQLVSDAKLLLAKALFLANCFSECLDILKTCEQAQDTQTLSELAKKAFNLDLVYERNNEEFQALEKLEQREQRSLGSIMTVPYPWNQYMMRNYEIIQHANNELDDRSFTECKIQKSRNLGSKLVLDKPVWETDHYGIHAMAPIPKGGYIFEDRTILCGTDSPDRCVGCASDLECVTQHFEYREELCCSQLCVDDIDKACAFPVQGKCEPPLQALGFEKEVPHTAERTASFKLLSRVLATVVAFTKSDPQRHPLMTPLVNRLTVKFLKKGDFSLYTHVIQPIKILEGQGVDVFEDTRYESWVVQTILARMDVNTREVEAHEDCTMAINPLYSFLNHSCAPNTDVVDDEKTTSSQLIFISKREIQAGEELTISYLNDEQLQLRYEERRKLLLPWTGGDCLCIKCKNFREERNRVHPKVPDYLLPWIKY